VAPPSHHAAGGGFRNPWIADFQRGFGSMFRWKVPQLFHPLPDDPSTFPLATPSFVTPRAAPDRLTVTWVGHATLLLQIGGKNVLTDPVWSARVSPVSFAGPRRWTPVPFSLDALPPIDLVLISHNHYDHLDAPTIRRLTTQFPSIPWLAPLGLTPLLHRLGARDVRVLDWWDETDVAGLNVSAVPAQHFSARTPWDRYETLWCGWTIRDTRSGRSAYFAGDSGYCAAFREIGAKRGPFDVAMIPIGAYDPRWFMTPVHMNPEEAVQAYRDIQANGAPPAMVPIHWGTFKLTDEPMDEPVRRLNEAWRVAGLDPARL